MSDELTPLQRVLKATGAEDLVALAGLRVSGYKRRGKSGKMMDVAAYWRVVRGKDLVKGMEVEDAYGAKHTVESVNGNLVTFKGGKTGAGSFRVKPQTPAERSDVLRNGMEAAKKAEYAKPHKITKGEQRNMDAGLMSKPGAVEAGRAKDAADPYTHRNENGKVTSTLKPGRSDPNAPAGKRPDALSVLKSAVQEQKNKDTARNVAAGDAYAASKKDSQVAGRDYMLGKMGERQAAKPADALDARLEAIKAEGTRLLSPPSWSKGIRVPPKQSLSPADVVDENRATDPVSARKAAVKAADDAPVGARLTGDAGKDWQGKKKPALVLEKQADGKWKDMTGYAGQTNKELSQWFNNDTNDQTGRWVAAAKLTMPKAKDPFINKVKLSSEQSQTEIDRLLEL